MPRFVEHDDVYVGGVKMEAMGLQGATENNLASFDDGGAKKDSLIPAAEVTRLSAANQDKLAKVLTANDVIVVSANGAIVTSGIALITGGDGLAGLTLAAPTPGCRCEIRVDSITSGTVVVTCAAEVTLDGTNDIATFDDVAEALVLGYKSATQWQIVQNVGSVALSATPAG